MANNTGEGRKYRKARSLQQEMEIYDNLHPLLRKLLRQGIDNWAPSQMLAHYNASKKRTPAAKASDVYARVLSRRLDRIIYATQDK